MLFSIALAPRTPPGRLPPLGLVIAEAVCDATWPDAEVRWPNDVVVGGRKLAGVLAELREGRLVVGIGVNANLTEDELPPEARVPATSLRILRGAPVDRAQLLADLVAAIEAALPALRRARLPRPRSATSCAGARSSSPAGARGRCEGVDGEGTAGRRRPGAHVGRGDGGPRGRRSRALHSR